MAAIDQLLGFDFGGTGLSPEARQRLRVAQAEAARGVGRSTAAAMAQGPVNPLAASSAVRDARQEAQTSALRTVLEQDAQRRQAQLAQARQTIGTLLSTGGQAIGFGVGAHMQSEAENRERAEREQIRREQREEREQERAAREGLLAPSLPTQDTPPPAASAGQAGPGQAVAGLLRMTPAAPAAGLVDMFADDDFLSEFLRTVGGRRVT